MITPYISNQYISNYNINNFLNLNNDTDEIIKELNDLEIINLYINDFISIDTAYDNILEKSRNCGIDPITFLKKANAFLKANSNLEKKHLIKINELGIQIQKTIEGEKLFQEFEKMIHVDKPSSKSQRFFIQHIDKLKLFLSSKHKEMLALPNRKDKQKQNEYRHINRTFRDFFIVLAKIQKDIKNVKNSYDRILEGSFGRQDHTKAPSSWMFFSIKNAKLDTVYNIQAFIDELMNFRKNYKCRYSIDKVKKAIEKEIAGIRNNSNLFDYYDCFSKTKDMHKAIKKKTIEINDLNLSLLKMTFMHGTNSFILENLPRCQMKLMPIGHLVHKGIVPLSGELKEGAILQKDIIKNSEISSTTLDDGGRSFSYAEEENFHPDINKEKRYIDELLEIIRSYKSFFVDEYRCAVTLYWPKYCIAILRLRLMDKQFFTEIEEELRKGIDALKTSFEHFKTTVNYSNLMPTALDPNQQFGYAWHDDYWFKHFKKTEQVLATLKEVLDNSLLPIEKRDSTSPPYPIIFGSMNIHTKWRDINDNLERRTQKFCQLGKEIETVFVNEKNKNEFSKYLKTHNLENKVSVIDNKILKEAFLLNQLASHYLADFASCKKLSKINEDQINEEFEPINEEFEPINEEFELVNDKFELIKFNIWDICDDFVKCMWGSSSS